jgi:hypothetical protein
VAASKFNHPEFVARETSKILDTTHNRNKCKKKHDKIKAMIRDKRAKYSDMSLESIMQKLESRIHLLQRNIKFLINVQAKIGPQEVFLVRNIIISNSRIDVLVSY